MYLVTAKTKATAQDFPGSTVEWAVGQTREVHDSLIQEFKNNPAAWTVSGGATTSTVTATSSAQGVVFTAAGKVLIDSIRSRLGRIPMSLTAVGNSIVIGSGLNGKSPFANQMPGLSYGKLTLKTNLAVGGYKSIDIIKNLLPLVPKDTGVLLTMEGTNDATAALPVATHITQLDTICNYGLGLGALPFVVSTPPNSESGAKEYIEKYALAQRVYCEDRGIPFSDPWSEYTDVDGTLKDVVQGDGKHFDIVLHSYAAKENNKQLFSGSPGLLLPRSDTDQAGVIKTNALMTAGSTTPTSWVIAGVTSSEMTAGVHPVRGRWSEHTCTGAAAATNNIYRDLGDPLTWGNPGDVVRVVGFFKFANTSNANLAARLWIAATPVNVSTWLFDTPVSFDETYFSVEAVIPSGTTGTSRLYVQHGNSSAGTYSCTFGFAGLQVYNITQARIIQP